MNKKKTYSAEEKKAYYMGMGAALGHGRVEGIRQTTSFLSDKKLKDSYFNGFDCGLELNRKLIRNKKNVEIKNKR